MSLSRIVYIAAIIFLAASIFAASEVVKTPFFGVQPSVGEESFAYILKLAAFLSLGLLLITPKIK